MSARESGPIIKHDVRQLFGDLAAPGLLASTGSLQRAHAAAERGHAVSGELAVGAYLVMRLVDASLEAAHTRAERAAFVRHMAEVGRHVRRLPPRARETRHLLDILTTLRPGGTPGDVAFRLLCYAHFLEYHGRLEEALQALSLNMRVRGHAITPLEVAEVAAFAGRLNRVLARWDEALACYRIAEAIGGRHGYEPYRLWGQSGRGAVARIRGDLAEARLIAEAASREADRSGIAHLRNIAYANLAEVYSQLGRRDDAVRAHQAALVFATNTTDRLQALGDLGIQMLHDGDYDGARVALDFVARAKTVFRLRANASIELMDLESALGDRAAFEHRRRIGAACRDRMAPSMLVDYLFKTGVGLARFGEAGRADVLLGEALDIARQHLLGGWSRRIEHARRTDPRLGR